MDAYFRFKLVVLCVNFKTWSIFNNIINFGSVKMRYCKFFGECASIKC